MLLVGQLQFSRVESWSCDPIFKVLVLVLKLIILFLVWVKKVSAFIHCQWHPGPTFMMNSIS